MKDATPQFRRRLPDTFDRTDNIAHEFIDVVGATVRELPLGQRPDTLIGIEVRRIGWEILDVEARMLALELAERFTAVGCGVIQEGNHRAPQVPKQVSEEHAHFLLTDILKIELVEESKLVPLGADRDP